MIDSVGRLGPNHRLGAIRDADVCLRQHRQVVCAIADGDDQTVIAGKRASEPLDRARFDLRIDDRPLDVPGEPAVAHLQYVGDRVI